MENQPLNVNDLKARMSSRLGGDEALLNKMIEGQRSQDFFPETNLPTGNGENNPEGYEPLKPADPSQSAAD